MTHSHCGQIFENHIPKVLPSH
nr:unnamed protein product [Callosobruchus analis]